VTEEGFRPEEEVGWADEAELKHQGIHDGFNEPVVHKAGMLLNQSLMSDVFISQLPPALQLQAP
jgi:hypothetical protein